MCTSKTYLCTHLHQHVRPIFHNFHNLHIRLFSSQVWLADSARLSTQDKTIAEYDFLNVIFCREQV